MNDLERAIDLAVEVHAGQTDKADATYIRHPLRVMTEMETERARVVAVLHDVVEDSDYTLDEIEDQFGEQVRTAVGALTKRDEEDESYQEFIERAAENELAARVKIADIEDNMDLTRLERVDEATLAKQAEYHDAWRTLRAEVEPDRSP